MESTFVMIQMEPCADPGTNLQKAGELTAEAIRSCDPDFIIFPETFMSSFPAGIEILTRNAVSEPLDGPFCRGMQKLAKDKGVWIAFGMKETVEDPADPRVYNTVVMLNAEGEIVSTYRKTHLYDAFGYKESDEFKAGDAFFEPVDTPFGKIGLFVCYEVRFPEVARFAVGRGAEILLMPTAWYKGEWKNHHFRTLVTARAIENTVYVLACDQCGGSAMGESLAVDPMGIPIACGGEHEEILPVRIDTGRVAEVRATLPSYKNRRPELY